MAKDKSKGIVAEFKKFISRGSVIDLAVGIIIGSAFTAIVNSLVNNIVMPVVSLLTKGLSFSEWFIALDGNKYDTLADATAAGAAVLGYGQFINAVLNFLIVAVVVFILVRGVNRVKEIGAKPEAPKPVTVKTCPYCKSEVNIDAVRCPHCTSELEIAEEKI